MPSDYLSRNAIDSINFEGQDIIEAQENDSLIGPIKRYLLNRELPTDIKTQNYIRHYALDCFIENDILWRRITHLKELNRIVLFLPQNLVLDVLKEAHGSLFGGHDGVLKTKERILKCYFWPGMDKNINDFISSCEKCQLRKTGPKISQALLSPLPQCTEPNQRIHVDLFGPLRVSGNGKKYILCITDAFTKYVELVGIPDKEAKTVTSAILNRWICRFGLPIEILSDMGGEFKNKLSESLWTMLGTSHSTTSPRHPQCNAQCEIANKTIAKYLSSYVNQDTLDWEVYLPPLMLYYNTSFHRSIKTSPFFLTFGIEPRLPNFPEPDLRRKFYGESDADEMKLRLLRARQIAFENNQDVTDKAKTYFDGKAKPVDYKVGQYVLLDEHSFLGKNTKLAPKYSGPHKIIRIKGNTNAELLTKNGKKVIVHFNRLKPFTFPFYEPTKSITNQTNLSPQKLDNTISQQKTSETETHDEVETRLPDLNLFRSQQKRDELVTTNAPPPTRPKASRKTKVVQHTRPPPPPPKPRPVRARPPPRPLVEQGGIASRTRSRVQIGQNEERRGGEAEKGEGDGLIENTGEFQFQNVTDEFAPEISPIKAYNLSRDHHKKLIRPHLLIKKRVKKTHTQNRLTKQIGKYLSRQPTSRKLVFSQEPDAPDIISDSDSDSSFDDPAGGIDTDYQTVDEGSDDSDASTIRTGSELGSATESEQESESELEPVPGPSHRPPVGIPGAAAKTPPKKVTLKESKLDKLVKQADQFLFKGYPKRNIPRPNYKE